MNDNLIYHPLDLDIGAILKEHTNQLIETLDIPEMQVSELTELLDDEYLFETPITEAIAPISLDSIGISTPNSMELEKLLEA
jgi:hypothetical protein